MFSRIPSTQPLDEPFILPPVSVHRLELPKEQNHIYREDTNRKIENGIILFFKGIAQEAGIQRLRHRIKTIHGFRVRIFFSRKPGISLLSQQLEEDNRDKIFERASTDYLIFLIRVSSKAHHDLYAATTGNMFNIIAPYVDYHFSRRVAKRFVSPDLYRMNMRHLTGSTLKSSLLFCGRPNFSSVELQTRFITDFVAPFKSSSSIYCLISPHDKPKLVNVEVKMKLVRINAELELDVFTSILDHYSMMYRSNTPTFQCVHFRKKKEQIPEEDDPNFFFLDLITRAPYGVSRKLDGALCKRLWKLCLNPSDSIGLRFWHRFADDFLQSGTFTLFYKTQEIDSWTAPPTIVEVMNALLTKSFSSDEEQFIKELPHVMFGFNRNGEFFKERLIKFFEVEITLPTGEVFFRNHGLWLQVSAEYLVLVQNDFLDHLSTCLMRRTDPGQLPKAWISKSIWTAVKWRDLEALVETCNPEEIGKVWENLSPILEPFSKNEQKRKRDSQPTGQKKRQKTSTSERSIKSHFDRSKGSSPPLPGQDDSFLVRKDPSQLEDLPEGLQALLCEKHREYQNVKKEGEYNGSYIGEGSFLVGDRITPHGVELFDILQIVEDALYLYQVKESFSETTTKACSQIQNAAQALSSALHSPFSASTILEKFWDKAVRGEKNDPYFIKVKKSYEDFGRTEFLNLFKRDRKKICFVLALLDDAVSERLLENEVNRSIEFKESDFKNLDKTVSGSQIIKALKDNHYMADNGQISSSIYKKSHTKFFLGEKFSSRLTSLIFHKIFSKLTRFSSTMAKVGIGQTRKVVEDLGFTFKICQIARPVELLSADHDSTQDDQSIWESCLDSSTPPLTNSSSSYSSRDSFSFQESTFTIIETPGDGSCGLHALVGEIEDGVCSFSETNLKEDFVNRIRDNLDNPEVQRQLQLCLIDLLEIALGPIRQYEADLVFSQTQLSHFKREYERADQELKKRLDGLVNLEGKAWIELLNKSPQFKLRSEILAEKFRDRNKHFGAFKEGDEKLILQAIDNRRDEILNRKVEYRLEDADLVQINRFREERLDNHELTEMKEAFVLMQEIRDHYFQCLQDPSYYLSTQELKLAAYLYQINVTIFKRGENDIEVAERYTSGDDDDTEEVFIYHHFPDSQHFSRCDKQGTD